VKFIQLGWEFFTRSKILTIIEDKWNSVHFLVGTKFIHHLQDRSRLKPWSCLNFTLHSRFILNSSQKNFKRNNWIGGYDFLLIQLRQACYSKVVLGSLGNHPKIVNIENRLNEINSLDIMDLSRRRIKSHIRKSNAMIF
jgi:hypothetical protein